MMIPALAATASAENSELADRYAKVYASRRDFSPSNVNPFWIRESSSFRYVRETPEGRLYVRVDAGRKDRITESPDAMTRHNKQKTTLNQYNTRHKKTKNTL